jgi:hypothetical protein
MIGEASTTSVPPPASTGQQRRCSQPAPRRPPTVEGR